MEGLSKNKELIDVMIYLHNNLDFTKIEITDYWDAALDAIGIKYLNKVCYISITDLTDLIYYEIELLLDGNDPSNYQIINKGTVKAKELVKIIKKNFEI